MRIGLIDVDGHNYPNLPLMKISAWHKAQGDHVEWYQPMFSGHMDKVYMSKVFSFTPDYEWCIDADEIIKGGSGYCISLVDGKEVYDKSKDKDLPPEIEHIYPDYSIYGDMTKDTAYGFLTRGCPRGCGFCHVEAKEGRCSRKVADLSEFWRGQKNIVLCDPNILACKDHMELLQQLVDSKAKVNFNQGIDIRLVNDRNIELLKQIRLDGVHFAFDDYKQKDIIEPKLREFAEKTGFYRGNAGVMVYILCNFDTTLEQDIYRIQLCRELRFSPYPMIYDNEHADPVYQKLQRWCSNFIFWSVPTFEEYQKKGWKMRMDGQITLDSFIDGCTPTKIKRLIYSQSLTCYKTICPYCRIDNPEDRGFQYSEEERRLPLNVCRCCRKKFDDVNLDIRKSKDLMEVEKLGLHGAVYKDEKGNWREWQDPYAKKNVVEVE